MSRDVFSSVVVMRRILPESASTIRGDRIRISIRGKSTWHVSDNRVGHSYLACAHFLAPAICFGGQALLSVGFNAQASRVVSGLALSSLGSTLL